MSNIQHNKYEGEAAILFAEAMQGGEHIIGNLVVSRAIEIHTNTIGNQSNEQYNPMRAIELAYM